MTFLGFSKVLTRGVVGVVGLSAIAVLGAPQSAKAALLAPQKGTDYFSSPTADDQAASNLIINNVDDFNRPLQK